jgi:hypothetical protein
LVVEAQHELAHHCDGSGAVIGAVIRDRLAATADPLRTDSPTL